MNENRVSFHVAKRASLNARWYTLSAAHLAALRAALNAAIESGSETAKEVLKFIDDPVD